MATVQPQTDAFTDEAESEARRATPAGWTLISLPRRGRVESAGAVDSPNCLGRSPALLNAAV